MSDEGLDPTFSSSLMNLIAASNGRISIGSGYRSPEEQAALYAQAKINHPDDYDNWVAAPGKSNHNSGLAADLRFQDDDAKAWAHANAAAFGLYFPMPWEDWHIEPFGTRDTNLTPGNVTPPVVTNPARTTQSQLKDTGAILAELLGFSPVGALRNAYMPSTQFMVPNEALPGYPAPATPPLPAATATTTTADIDRFMAAIRSKESTNDYNAYNSQYGASGAYQFLDSTWNHYKGYVSARDAPPAIQDERARSLMLSYYQNFGNWRDVAAAWFSGPGGDFDDPEISSYATDVLRRMG